MALQCPLWLTCENIPDAQASQNCHVCRRFHRFPAPPARESSPAQLRFPRLRIIKPARHPGKGSQNPTVADLGTLQW